MLDTCAICGSLIWRTTTGLCEEHRRFAELKSAVAAGEKSDWYANTGGLVSHREMQTHEPQPLMIPRTAWQITVGDINRLARARLTDDDGGIAA